MACSLKHLQHYNNEGNDFFVGIATGDKTWVLYYTSYEATSMMRKNPSSPVRKEFTFRWGNDAHCLQGHEKYVNEGVPSSWEYF
ncbi:hypothetical protein NPIL_375651 [Nephila pilipes]|uniref:Uncharacterized protein n=1 Tax=Nephila pilipes TaxID=299642 RepID=A0A8X6T7W9_NEPPI|nr:hypothetical protein NPIL_375651 [Nephila pilipes]